jgi:hypothetical protein
MRSLAEPVNPSRRATVEFGFGHNFGQVQVHAHLPYRIQTKLAVSQPGDQYEQEADRVAEQLTGATLPPVSEEKQAAPLSGTEPGVQRMPTNGAAASPEVVPTPAPAMPEPASPEATPRAGLIVEDEAGELGLGQMRKTEFLDELQRAVCSVADAELAAVDQSIEGCPYIERWIGYYRTRDSQHVERAIRRYAPETAGVTAARDYIPLIGERVRRAVAVWARTGEITGVPEGVSTEMPGAGTETGAEGTPTAAGSVQFKGRDGGAVEARDLMAMRAQLDSGRALDTPVKSQMESAFGYDFSRVRVHTNSKAATVSKSLNARAFTIGSDIAFASGEYQPGTLIGDALIAHELAHVVQQGGGVGSSTALMQMGETGYNALEEDADQSAVGAIVSLWSGAKGALAEIAQNAMPRLRSGLRLSRCPAKTQTTPREKVAEPKKEETKEAAKPVSVTHAADMKCEPEPKTWDEIRNIPGLSAGVLGLTQAAPLSLGLEYKSENGKCKLTITDEPRLRFIHFVHTKAGDYKFGTVTIPFDPCKGKVGDLYFRITPDMAEKIKQGEIEHCEDEKIAFSLSWERYMQAIREVAATEIPGNDVPACETEVYKRLTEKTGIEVSKWKSVAQCLLDKTLERDNIWHKVEIFSGGAIDPDKVSKFILDANCTSLTLELDHTKLLTEIGNDKHQKHPSKDLIKGCGEKQP